MTFEEIVDQAIEMVRRRGQVSYRMIKRQFDLDDDVLEDLKEEILYAQPQVVDDKGKGFIWSDKAEATTEPESSSQPEPPTVPEEPSTQAASHTQDAERRQLTVLFCDLVESTALSGRLDPEDLREVIRSYQAVCTEVIQRYDGHVAQLLGDGLLVYFGYPQAHEDDAQRAVRAGLGMLEAMGTLNSQLQDVQLAIRVGIHTGLVVVGEMGGEGRQEQLALGETPNVAARIQGLAEPDSVVMSEATSQLVQGFFHCEYLGEQNLRGVAQSINVYRVLQETGAQSRLDIATTRGLTALVGRESEVALLLDRWQQAKTGSGQVVLLRGEAGIGKSRLVQVLKEHAAELPHVRLECRSSPYYQNTALYPITDLVQRTLQRDQEDTADEKLSKLEQALGRYRPALEESVPLFAALLSLPASEDRYPPLNLAPERQRQKTLETLVAMFVEESERQPVLFIVEDLHWTDPTTLEFLDLMIDQSATASMFTLLTCRPEFEPHWPHRSHLAELSLNRLSRLQVEQIATQVASGKALPADVIEQLVDKTDGVPLYVEEMTKSILDSDALKETNHHYELSGPIALMSIPVTLQDSLMARLDRLMTAKVIAQLGATIGRQFSYELLQAVSQLDDATLERELGRLVESELIYQRGLPPQATYIFKHALIQDAAHQALLKSTRQQYHQQLVQILEERFPDTAEAQPELVAHHAFQGEVWDKAVIYFRQAGTEAMARSAHREVVACFDRALGAIEHLPEDRVTMEQALTLHLALRNALQPLGESDRLHAILLKAEILADTLGDQPRLGEIYGHMINYYWWAGEPERALAYGERALPLATGSEDAGSQAALNFQLGLAYGAMGHYSQSIAHHRNVLAATAGDQLYQFITVGNLLSVMSRNMLVWIFADCGEFTEGMTIGEEGLEIAETAAHPGTLLRMCLGLGHLHLCKGELPQAMALLERSVALCHQSETPLWFPAVAAHLGYAYALSGRLEEAIQLLEQATEQSAVKGRMAYRTRQLTYLSEAYLLSGRLKEASAQSLKALEFCKTHKTRGDQAYVCRLLGDIAMHRDPPNSSETATHYQQAFSLATELGMRPLQAHCYRCLGALHHQTGQIEQARAELSTASEMYREMEMTFWLPETEAALAEVESR